MDPSRGDGRPAEHDDVFEEIDVDEVPRVRMAVTVWDRALVGLSAIAIAGGLTIALISVIGGIPSGDVATASIAAASPSTVETAAPSPSGPPPRETAVPTLHPGFSWEQTAIKHRGSNGERFRYVCAPGGTPLPLWGTRVYTDDSSVCTAAVHWGLITLEDGGTVAIEIRRGRDSYRGTHRNGVASQDWPELWHGSFVFVRV